MHPGKSGYSIARFNWCGQAACTSLPYTARLIASNPAKSLILLQTVLVFSLCKRPTYR